MLVHLDHTIQIWREGGTYVARAHPLDVMSCGESLQAARRNLEEALQLFIKVAAEQGTLDEILHEAGYISEDQHWIAPEILTSERISLSLSA